MGRLNKSETVREVARDGYVRWIACIGGMFGSSQPRLAQALRLHYGSFKEFVSVHAVQIPHPRPPAPVASQDHSVSTGIVNAGAAATADVVPRDDEQMLHDGAAPIESTDDPTIVWLTSSKNLHLPGEELQPMQQPHPVVLNLVQAAGQGGIDVVTLRGQLELGLRLRRTIKTPRLVAYLKACPAAFHVSETAGVSGIIHRVHALHLERPSSSAA